MDGHVVYKAIAWWFCEYTKFSFKWEFQLFSVNPLFSSLVPMDFMRSHQRKTSINLDLSQMPGPFIFVLFITSVFSIELILWKYVSNRRAFSHVCLIFLLTLLKMLYNIIETSAAALTMKPGIALAHFIFIIFFLHFCDVQVFNVEHLSVI